jgi:hypothetical protein
VLQAWINFDADQVGQCRKIFDGFRPTVSICCCPVWRRRVHRLSRFRISTTGALDPNGLRYGEVEFHAVLIEKPDLNEKRCTV